MSVEIQKSLRSDGFTKDSTSQISSLNKNCFLLPKIFKGLKSDEDVGHSINQLFFNAIRLTLVKIIKLHEFVLLIDWLSTTATESSLESCGEKRWIQEYLYENECNKMRVEFELGSLIAHPELVTISPPEHANLLVLI